MLGRPVHSHGIWPLLALACWPLSHLGASETVRTGDVELHQVRTAEGHVLPSLKVWYKFDLFFGEPLEQFSLVYESANNERLAQAEFVARLVSQGRKLDVFARLRPLPDHPGRWSWPGIPGSPNWDRLFVDAAGTPLPANSAREIYQAGFSLTDLQVVRLELIPGAVAPAGPSEQPWRGHFERRHQRAATLTAVERHLPATRQATDRFHWLAEHYLVRPQVPRDRGQLVVESTTWQDGEFMHVAYRIQFDPETQGAARLLPMGLQFFWSQHSPWSAAVLDDFVARHPQATQEEWNLESGDVLFFADRIAKSQYDARSMRPWLLVRPRLPQQDQLAATDTSNPFRLYRQKIELAELAAKVEAERLEAERIAMREQEEAKERERRAEERRDAEKQQIAAAAMKQREKQVAMSAVMQGLGVFNQELAAQNARRMQSLNLDGLGQVAGNIAASSSGMAAGGSTSSGGSNSVNGLTANTLGADLLPKPAFVPKQNYFDVVGLGSLKNLEQYDGDDFQFESMLYTANSYWFEYQGAVLSGRTEAECNRYYSAHEQAAKLAVDFHNKTKR